MTEGPGESTPTAPPAAPPWVMTSPPPPARRMSWVGMFLVLLSGALLGSTCSTCARLQGGSESPFGTSGPRVGVVEVFGTIATSREVVEALANFSGDEEIEAVVLRVDSPGGSVGPSQEIYEAVRRTASVKPVVASMGSMAASGGYWISLGADEIFANPGTLTGSIGVIVQIPDFTRIAELLRFDMRTYKSGPHKDIGNPLRPASAGDEAIFQALVDDIYRQFVELTVERRALDEDRVKPLADGRIMTGRHAQRAGLVDGLGGLETAARRALALAQGTSSSTTSLSEDSPTLVYPPEDLPPLLDMLGISLSEAVSDGLSTGVERGLRGLEKPRLEVR